MADIEQELRHGRGLVYVHVKPGQATHVVLTIERFQEVAGGYDPGHDDSFAHSHYEGKPWARPQPKP